MSPQAAAAIAALMVEAWVDTLLACWGLTR